MAAKGTFSHGRHAQSGPTAHSPTNITAWVAHPLRQLRHRLSGLETPPGLTLLSALGVVCGLACGGVIILFHLAIDAIQSVDFAPAYHASGDQLPVHLRVALPLIGAALLGLMYQMLAPRERDGGIVHIIERLAYHQGYLPIKNALIQFVGAVIGLCTGQSVGREGVAAHMGAATSSWVAGQLELPNNSVRTLVGCGTAAGIAASFNTPLAGVIFAMEVVMMEYSIVGFAPIILAAISATAVTHVWMDTHPQLFVISTGMESILELPWMAFGGALIGLAAVAFTRMTTALTHYFAPQPVSLRMLQAGAVTALCAMAFPQIIQIGFDSLNGALAGEFMLWTAVGIAVAKILATAFAAASLMPGGVIMPSLLMGASLGGAIGLAGAHLAPDHASSVTLYALLGMGAMMGAVLQAPLTALIVILELSGRTEIVFPAMLMVITAILVARESSATDSIFAMLLRDRGLDYRNDPVSQSLRRVSVVSTMDRSLSVTGLSVTRAQAEALVADNPRWILARRDDGRSGYLLPTADLARFLESDDCKDLDADDTVTLTRFPAQRLQAGPIHLRATLQEAYDTLERTEAEALYVQRRVRHDERTIYGVLTREAIEQAYMR